MTERSVSQVVINREGTNCLQQRVSFPLCVARPELSLVPNRKKPWSNGTRARVGVRVAPIVRGKIRGPKDHLVHVSP